MSDAIIAYVTWDRVVPWKILSLPRKNTKHYPIGYGSNQPVFKKYARKGAFLWVVTLPWVKLPGKKKEFYEPTLVAQIKIKHQCHKNDCPKKFRTRGIEDLLDQWVWVAVSDPKDSEDSGFFELNNATRALVDLGFLKSKELITNPRKSKITRSEYISTLRSEFGKQLRFIRPIPGGAELVKKAFRKCMQQAKKQNVFISYLHSESELALSLAKELLVKGFSPWFDALAIPQYDIEREKGSSPKRLDKLLELGIDASKLAICLVDKDYACRKDAQGISWTRKELDRILKKREKDKKFRCIQVIRDAKKFTGFNKEFQAKSAKKLATQIADWWKQENIPSTDII